MEEHDAAVAKAGDVVVATTHAVGSPGGGWRPAGVDADGTQPARRGNRTVVSDRELFRQAFRRWATTVVVVTYRDDKDQPVGMTATSMSSLSVGSAVPARLHQPRDACPPGHHAARRVRRRHALDRPAADRRPLQPRRPGQAAQRGLAGRERRPGDRLAPARRLARRTSTARWTARSRPSRTRSWSG